MRFKRNWLNCTLLSLLLVFALLIGACAAPATTGDGSDMAMEEDAGDDMAELPGIQYAENPDTVDSDRLLILPGRTRFGVGMWGGMTAGNWNFGSESFYMVEMPLIFMGPMGNTTPRPGSPAALSALMTTWPWRSSSTKRPSGAMASA